MKFRWKGRKPVMRSWLGLKARASSRVSQKILSATLRTPKNFQFINQCPSVTQTQGKKPLAVQRNYYWTPSTWNQRFWWCLLNDLHLLIFFGYFILDLVSSPQISIFVSRCSCLIRTFRLITCGWNLDWGWFSSVFFLINCAIFSEKSPSEKDNMLMSPWIFILSESSIGSSIWEEYKFLISS